MEVLGSEQRQTGNGMRKDFISTRKNTVRCRWYFGYGLIKNEEIYEKKIVCFVLCAGLAVTYSGCGSAAGDTDMQGKVMEDSRESTEENENEQVVGTSLKPDEELKDIIPQDTVTLDVYSQITNFEEMQEGWFAQVMLDKFNVKLNIVSDKEDSTYENRAATGDLGDIVIFGNDTEQYHSALTNGLLLNWEQNDYLVSMVPTYRTIWGKHWIKTDRIPEVRFTDLDYDVALDSGEIADFSYSSGYSMGSV